MSQTGQQRHGLRRVLRFLLAAALLALVAVAAMPLWFPWLLRPAAASLGARYQRCERVGYQRFELIGFSLTNNSGHFQARRVQAFVPTVWLWRRFVGPKSAPFLQVDSWSWKSVPTRPPPRPAAPAYATVQKFNRAAAKLRDWLPKARLTNGTVTVAGQSLRIPGALWSDGTFSAQVFLPRAGARFTVLAVAQRGAPWKLRIDSAQAQVRSRFSIAATRRGFELDGAGRWLTNRIVLRAVFPRRGQWPETASLRASAFAIPARLLKLERRYHSLTGSLLAEWRTNRFTLNLTARATARQPAAEPPLELAARVSGDTNSARIDAAQISTPWLDARLSTRTEVLFKPPFLPRPATLTVTADLEQQPWLAVRGQLSGHAVLRPSRARFPQIDFALSGTNVALEKFQIRSELFQLRGRLVWPRLDLTGAEMKLADDSELSLLGSYNLKTKTLSGGRASYSGGFVRRFLPRGYSLQTALLSARFDGPLRALTNSASAEIGNLVAPHSNPMRLRARWQGRGLNLQQAQLTVAAGNSSLRLRGAAALGGAEKKLTVTALDLDQSNRVELRLQKPFALIFRTFHAPGGANPPVGQTKTGGADLPVGQAAGSTHRAFAWSLTLEPVSWSGHGRELQLSAALDWPTQGAFQITARNLPAKLAADFFRGPVPDARLDALALDGGWTNGPLDFRLSARAGVKTQEGIPFQADAQIRGGAAGVAIDRLEISSATQAVCRAQGSLPVALEPANGRGAVHVLAQAPLRLTLHTAPHSVLWKKIAAATGAQLRAPRLEAELGGTWAAPRGSVLLQARQIELPRIKRPLPAMENLDIAAELNRELLRVSRFNLRVAGQPIQFAAQLPLEKNFWLNPARELRRLNWRRATARLEMTHAQLGALTNFPPQILAPQGSVSADLALKPGGVLSGNVSLAGAATRPLPDIGPVQNIGGGIVFAGTTARLTNFSADIGGERVTATGDMPLNEGFWERRGLPPFELRLRGTNVPLVREPGLVLRADLDLTASNPASGPARVSGTVRLENGLFLADLNSLVPRAAAAPAQRPPYFSIATAPWSAWRLDLNVSGERFMRVQTPLFNGVVSSALRLQGTLGSPLALGEVRINSGAVTFPFGSLAVQQGFVSLTSGNPYQPQLFVAANTEQFGYNLTLQVTGPADAPIVQFSSVPSLSSEQILLMLTTGQLPAGTGLSYGLQQRAQGLALFLGRNLLSEFGFGSGMQNRLTIRSGQRISEAGRPTYDVEYKLSKRWSIEAEYDRFDQYDLNAKWLIYSK